MKLQNQEKRAQFEENEEPGVSGDLEVASAVPEVIYSVMGYQTSLSKFAFKSQPPSMLFTGAVYHVYLSVSRALYRADQVGIMTNNTFEIQ